jgi:putative ABC transport system ATP-binding protein
MEDKMIEFNDITKHFTNGTLRTDVLNGVTFKINKGEFTAIMAPSGTGKTTLLNILGCLMKASGGSYLFEGQDIETLNDDMLSGIRNKKLGFVFQSFNLLEKTSALDNVMLPLVYSDVYPADAVKKASLLLESVGLQDRINYKPGELSGGQQQRVAIARALINDPSVILADEPTGNLDENSAKEIMEIFRTLHKEGRTIILVTHDVNVARTSDRIIYLNAGKVEREEVLK